MLRAYKPQKELLTLCIQVRILIFGCIDVSTPSTGYDPKARNDGSTRWLDSACREKTRVGIYALILLGIQRCETSQGQTWYPSKSWVTGGPTQVRYYLEQEGGPGRAFLLWNRALVLRHHNEHFQVALPEQQRLARDAVCQAVLDSSGRSEKTWSLKLSQAQFNNESTMQ